MNYDACTYKAEEGGPGLDPLFVDGDLRNDGVSVYYQVEDREKLKQILSEKLEDYNMQPRNIEMNLVLFKEAIDYLCRIHRAIKSSGGHCLLVGVGGSGRHSLTRLATFIGGYDYIQLEITKNYRLVEFREDIKKMKWRAGVENHPIVFMFSDNDVMNELFLEDVNNLLSSGEVPNIYSNDEIKDIREAMRKEAKKLKKSETPDALSSYFWDHVKENLHIVFCISPIGDKFREYCRVYPALINNTTISWFMPWPEDALYEVAHKYTHEGLDFKTKLKDAIANVFCNMHLNVLEATRKMHIELKRNNYVTPTHYLELVLGYIKLLHTK